VRVLTVAVPVLLVVLPTTVFVAVVQRKDNRQVLVPGPTSAGHHQIEGKCELCHRSPFRGVDEQACRDCHGAALAQQNDSHAADKFLDPVRAQMLVHTDAGSCLSCHREHRPEAQQRGSVSVAADFCFPCHAQVRTERASHRDFGPSTCADRGCHNYHDNRALHRELLERERTAPAVKAPALLPLPSALRPRAPPLARTDADLPHAWDDSPEVPDAISEWSHSSHARGGVNCSQCHVPEAAAVNEVTPWKVAPATCGACHGQELADFHGGKHGMRAAVGLSAMTPALARLPMKPLARDHALDCNACHRAHDFDRTQAAVEACESCHDDRHTRAYRLSAHFELLEAERAGELPAGTGVSCASCHLPRRPVGNADASRVVAVHNQNDNLRPSDRMARDVCMHCHGLGYALDALADPTLIESNFQGAPSPDPRERKAP
jgi:predicted CXXCH cytochrome family protein